MVKYEMSELAMKEKIRSGFNAFNASRPEVLDSFYAADAVFQDPVTRVEGLDRIRSYFLAVYRGVQSIRFDFGEIVVSGSTCTAPWTMTLSVKALNGGRPYEVEGVSVIRFNDAGLVSYHRDYLDLGAMVYERIPLVGNLVRLVRRGLEHS